MSLEQYFDISKAHINKNKFLKVIWKLQTLISPSEANNYKVVCEIFDKFLERGLIHEETFSDTHNFLRGWIITSEQSPKQVLHLVKHVFQIVIDKVESINNHSPQFLFIQNKNVSVWLVLATLMSLSQIPNLIIEGMWEEVLHELLKYTRTWDMDRELSFPSPNVEKLRGVFCENSSLSLIETAGSAIMCPSPYLRLEIIRLLALLDPNGVKFIYGMKIMTAYVECMCSINPEQLFVIMGNDLLSMLYVMFFVCKRYYSTLKIRFSGKVDEDLNQNKIGKEVGFVVNYLKIIGLFALLAKKRYKDYSYYLRKCLNVCVYLLLLGHNNIFSKKVFNHRLLLPFTSSALADITDGILTLYASMNNNEHGPRIRSKRMLLFNKLVKRRNDLVNVLKLPKEQFHIRLCQREQSSHKFNNILLVKKEALTLTKFELGICGDEIKSNSYDPIMEDDDSFTDSDDGSESSYSNDDSVFLEDQDTSSDHNIYNSFDPIMEDDDSFIDSDDDLESSYSSDDSVPLEDHNDNSDHNLTI